MGSDQRREIARTAVTDFKIPESRACKLANIDRSVYRYKPVKKDDSFVESEILKHIERYRYGCPMIIKKIRRSGVVINHKRIRRVYRKLSLTLPKKVRKRLPERARRVILQPLQSNLTWSMDFMSDSLVDGRKFRTLNIMDDYNREILTMDISTSIPSERVIRVLDRLGEQRGLPEQIRIDNGPEYISNKLRIWANKNTVELMFIQPGKPTQNSLIERLNGTCRNDLLNANWFFHLDQVRKLANEWMHEYNFERPHQALGDRTPIEFSTWRANHLAEVLYKQKIGFTEQKKKKTKIKENCLI